MSEHTRSTAVVSEVSEALHVLPTLRLTSDLGVKSLCTGVETLWPSVVCWYRVVHQHMPTNQSLSNETEWTTLASSLTYYK